VWDLCGLLSGEDESYIYELFVWLRGAYRNSGLGRSAVRALLNERVREAHRELQPDAGDAPISLRVRLPVSKLKGPGGELQKRMWLTFFSHHGFTGDTQKAEIVLQRTI
jgi:GNAT superfamily N-acetyltransferase